jgi:hypothetical protein
MPTAYKWRMNVVVARGSLAESISRKWTEVPMRLIVSKVQLKTRTRPPGDNQTIKTDDGEISH